ncbi:MFS transporter [Streptomyces sp. NPDC026673]|uniref:MFS transporter n=1 Tax=Streptomyces sp. NPDC026673 TaxID=3155724 RepID=UPI003410649F
MTLPDGKVNSPAVGEQTETSAHRNFAQVLVPRLLGNRPFRWYWGASTISMLGDGVSLVAIPLVAAVSLNASPAQMGFLGVLFWVPSLIFSLHAGAWVDRLGNQRLVMIGANLGSFAALISIPVTFSCGVLSLPQLWASVFLVGSFSVLFTVSDNALFASLVPPDRYVEGQSLMYGSQSAASLAGPSAGGVLVQIMTAPFAILVDALSFLGSALMLVRAHTTEPPPDSGASRGMLAECLRFIMTTATIRTALATTSTVNFFSLMFHTLVILFLSRDLHMSAGVIGLLFAGEAAGGLLGAVVTKGVAKKIGIGRSLLLGAVSISAPLIIVPLIRERTPVTELALALVFFGSGLGRAIQNISVGAIFTMEVPNRMRSRARGAFQMVSFGARPVGAAIGGILGSVIGLPSTLMISACGGLLVIFWILPSRLLHYRQAGQGSATA